jgi:uncharacterized OB-fold protein
MSDNIPAQYARCPVCGEASFPQHLLSPCGHDAPPELVAFDAPGEVYSWTRTHGDDGAVLAMADFLEGELRVTAPVVGGEDVAIGDRVVVVSHADGSFALAREAS